MGAIFSAGFAVELGDRLLAHLEVVIVNRLRRGECVLVSWIDDQSVGDGRSTLWLSPHVPVYFKFDGSRAPSIDRQWLARLEESAKSSKGLVLQDGQGDLVRARGLVWQGWAASNRYASASARDGKRPVH